ncbi:hypothetical protein A3A95_00395 [Candidatus Nomurabacteria bacterium RIFCSPLOWO2_01_FULL_39_18]|uniref:GIY-YIG domain-containing protein n=1 Tax=Candidatus Nomurabacteria bacterium RIFCSPHIGHO2_01_FULL_40_24b TaxID=1801739 RepID=A0A1F6V928_9BACT|nr:MAG: hypothetical protein A2647_03245 [Candidatus Nomurabacteria bacterium RIFCSPHIGHO2_01_FULL_40_24b]OGI90533.1 MAG: hypothetical protein A3A95_00395 [Candidatus Nomurabacteria bacterium RIFCSPLOWO2_01_FULL_39_18]
MFTVYAIYSQTSDKIYIGQTIDIDSRLKQHNSNGGDHLGKFTLQNRGPWALIHKEAFPTRTEAIKRERQLKSFRGREFVKNLIKHMRP